MIDFLYKYFENPYWLFVILPLIGLLIYFTFFKDFIKIEGNNLKNKKIIVFTTRCFIFLLLLMALAGPFVEKYTTIHGDPKIKILIDNSTSMNVFDLTKLNQLRTNLEDSIPVEIDFIAAGEESPLGDNILSNMKRNENLLLITDGYSNSGLSLGDISLRSSNLNTTISAIELESKHYDASVTISGSDKTTSGVENTFAVEIKQTQKKEVNIIIEVDGLEIINTKTSESNLKFTKSFDEGYHKITAKINSDDYFKQNNVFYKTVKVVPKPKVLILGNNAIDLNNLFEPLYATVLTQQMPQNLDEFTAIIVDNAHASKLNSEVGKLTNFLAEGGGMFVIGGGNSFDAGGYKGSRFEQLLPVFVSKAGRKTGDTYVVLVIDVSGSTGHVFGDSVKVDVEKAIAVDMLQNLSLVNKVGVVAFNTQGYRVADIKPLIEHVNLNETIAGLRYSGGTYISSGLLLAMQMLEGKGGSKNIILISDGRNQDEDAAENAAAVASTKGIRIYTIGVGEDTNEENMIKIADFSGGSYFSVGSADRVRLLFGDNEIVGSKRGFPLTIFDENHFITKNLELKGNVYGYNQVVPKTSSKLLVTTDIGDPLVSVSRLGLGRVAALSTDYSLWGFELLNKDNSLLLTRITNWVIGDPERKNAKFIQISDGRVGEEIEILIKSDQQPVSSDVALFKTDEELYKGEIIVNEVGFKQLLDGQFAVNYDLEYEGVGLNPELIDVVKASDGKMFKIDQTEEIIEFIKLKSKRDTIAKKSYSWIFALIALILFLLEISYRRLVR